MADYGKKSAGQPAKKMADGGSVGFWERLRAGSIDDPSSEAYKRWGEGSKKAADPAAPIEAAPAPAPQPPSDEGSTSSRSDPAADAADNESSRKASEPADYSNEGRSRPSPRVEAPKKESVFKKKPAADPTARPKVTAGDPADEVKRETRGATKKKVTGMFSDSRAKTKKFDAGVKDAAIRNREAAAEMLRESRRGRGPDTQKKKVLSVAGLNPKTLLPVAYADGGLVCGNKYSKK